MGADSVGVVNTQTVRLFDSANPLRLESGAELSPVDVAYETYGTLNADRSNAIFICHALTGDAHAAGWHLGDKHPGWWDTMIGPGKPVDTNRFYVIVPNLLGGCQGTTGPASPRGGDGPAYGLDFPILMMDDLVRVHRALMAYLGVERLYAAMGGSLGGMQVLQWALETPEQMERAIVIAASSRLTAQNIAFSAVARKAIMSDPGFRGGRYAQEGDNPDTGLATARMLAHITYLSEDALSEKFGREPQFSESNPGFGVDFAVESYLDYQGESFVERFDALSYLYLTRVMDYFDPLGSDNATDAIGANPVNWLLISFDTDWRFGDEHTRRILRALERAEQPVTYRMVPSKWGHDSFLLEVPRYLETVEAFLGRPL
ncbi:MAG: homoserine O-acetyltransferase [Propionibacteriaceae bacterium]|jgi:homoserine O-acetyltransferase|nr:homoserine O-acetyltransferase [Propionibacteriaceae bacterium]